jgi:hypothetical protein
MGGKNDLKRATRRQRIFELRVLGLTIPQISETLKNEGYRIGTSEHTVYDDLHSGEAKEFVEELLRRQLANIAVEENRTMKLKYYDRLLDKLMPQKVESKVEGGSLVVMGYNLGKKPPKRDGG